MRQLVFAIVLLCASHTGWADSSDPDMLRFARAIGIYEQVEAQKQALEGQAAEVGKQYVAQILSAFPELPKVHTDAIDAAYNEFIADADLYIDTQTAVSSYLDLVAEQLTIKEIRKVTKFYESSVGKKYTEANTAIAGDWTRSFMEEAQSRAADSVRSYTEALQGIVAKARAAAEK